MMHSGPMGHHLEPENLLQLLRLYAAVLNRFEADLRNASLRTGVQMVCPEKFDQQWLEVSFIWSCLGCISDASIPSNKNWQHDIGEQ